MKKNICIIAPHPDDEILGCGGLIYHTNKNYRVSVIYVTNLKNDENFSTKQKFQRKNELKKIESKCNFSNTFNLEYPPSSLSYSKMPNLIKKFREIFEDIKPVYVFLPHQDDAHSDHFFSFKASYASLKSFRAPYIHKIFTYEVLSETNFGNYNFKPNMYFDIGKDGLKFKLDAVSVYKSEIKNHPFPRSKDSIKSLSILRGSEAGFMHAEGFCNVFTKYDKFNF